MIDVKMAGRIDNLTVHLNGYPFFCADPFAPGDIIRIPELLCMPFVLVQSRVVVRIDDGVSSLGQRYPAKSIAVTDPSIQ